MSRLMDQPNCKEIELTNRLYAHISPPGYRSTPRLPPGVEERGQDHGTWQSQSQWCAHRHRPSQLQFPAAAPIY